MTSDPGLRNNRDDWIRTSDLFHPKEARYQAAPRPDKLIGLIALANQLLMLASDLSVVNKSSSSRLST